MIFILHPDGLQGHADRAASALRGAYRGLLVETARADAAVPPGWSADPVWDDLLIIMYDDPVSFPVMGNRFITTYRGKHSGQGALLPVALSDEPARLRPPEA